jgi:thioredoxin 1
MMTWAAMVLAQCPCSGGGGDGDPGGASAWLILTAAFGAWLLARVIWNRKGASPMGKIGKIAVVVMLALAVGVVIARKKDAPPPPPAAPVAQAAAGLPRLVDLGSTTCIPCKKMAPILDELRKEYALRMQVEFIDVNEHREAAMSYGIKLIPTQVFLDASGKELWRHEGFLDREDILAKWKELGVSLDGPPAAASQPVGDDSF